MSDTSTGTRSGVSAIISTVPTMNDAANLECLNSSTLERKKSPGPRPLKANLPLEITNKNAAEKFNVSERLVKTGKQVLKKAPWSCLKQQVIKIRSLINRSGVTACGWQSSQADLCPMPVTFCCEVQTSAN